MQKLNVASKQDINELLDLLCSIKGILLLKDLYSNKVIDVITKEDLNESKTLVAALQYDLLMTSHTQENKVLDNSFISKRLKLNNEYKIVYSCTIDSTEESLENQKIGFKLGDKDFSLNADELVQEDVIRFSQDFIYDTASADLICCTPFIEGKEVYFKISNFAIVPKSIYELVEHEFESIVYENSYDVIPSKQDVDVLNTQALNILTKYYLYSLNYKQTISDVIPDIDYTDIKTNQNSTQNGNLNDVEMYYPYNIVEEDGKFAIKNDKGETVDEASTSDEAIDKVKELINKDAESNESYNDTNSTSTEELNKKKTQLENVYEKALNAAKKEYITTYLDGETVQVISQSWL